MGGKTQRVVFGHINAADFGKLDQFAFDHFLREVDKYVEDVKIALLQSDLKGLHVQPIASQDTAMIAPAGICGRTAPARVGAVDHIIMN